jgi:hypothetical protein
MEKKAGKVAWRGREAERNETRPVFEFSPSVIERFKQLEKAVSDSSVFDKDILQNLRESLKPNPMTVDRAVSEMAHYVREAQKHVSATGEKSARYALGDLMEVLSREEPCVVPATEPKKSR